MAAFFSWYIILTLLGWLTFPLAYWLFPALADRGYSLARTAGLLIWGYIYWLLNSLGLLQNNPGGLLFGLLVLAGLSLASFLVAGSTFESRKTEILAWLRTHLRLVLSVEILFFVAFAFLAFVRSGNPELDSTERPMELMFINAILRSPSFPPHDAWLSGYAISYYYFGYVMAAMLAMLTGLTGSVAHNLMTSLIFGLAAIGSYGILYNLLAAVNDRSPSFAQIAGDRPSKVDNRTSGIFPAFLAPLFLLLVSNLEGFLEVLHRHAILWTGPRNFWTWLGVLDLNQAPAQPLGWIPDHFWWWWRASRVISDYDLAGNFREVIDEFPFFSFLLGDLHPHVLAIPFNLLAVAVALNLILGGWRGETRLLGLRLHLRSSGFFAAALLLGGLAFLNTWDILIAAALIVFAYVLFRVIEHGWSWARLEDVFILGLPLGILAILLYLPFYFGFSSQAGGLLPNLINPTRGAQLWVMFAPLFLPIFAYLLYGWRAGRWAARWKRSLALVGGLVVLLLALSWVIGWVAFVVDPAFTQQYLASQDVPNIAAFLAAGLTRRLSYIGSLLTLLALLVPALAFLIGQLSFRKVAASTDTDLHTDVEATVEAAPVPNLSSDVDGAVEIAVSAPDDRSPVSSFILLLILLGGLLVLAPEFVYFRDVFTSRLNTIFKFYYQAWLLWSIAAAFAVAILLRNLKRFWGSAFLVGLLVLLAMSLTYPALALPNKTSNFQPTFGFTLDDFTRIQRNTPDDAAAILWLKTAPYGTLVEAVPDTGGSYTSFGRVSEYTGLPAVLGWVGHEEQWRGSRAPQGTRLEDIATLYSTPNWETARSIINKYNIRYIYIGDMERTTYTLQEEKFQKNLVQVFQQGSVTIYEAP